MFPIPGTRRRRYLEKNIAAFEIKLAEEELRFLEDAAGEVAGERSEPAGMASVNR